MTAEAPKYLLLGEVLRPHGVRGELRVRMLTDYPERIGSLEQIYLGAGPDDDNSRGYAVEHIRMHQNYGLLKLNGIDDRNAADPLRGLYVMIDLAHAVPLEEGEFYFYQLLGLSVKLADGRVLGTLVDVLETGANDVYLVDSPDYGEVLIPVTDETIVTTDIAGGEIVVDPPAGLLPD